MNADTILNSLPKGYRWADEWETEHWLTFRAQMVQVRVNPNDPDETDLAIRSDIYETGN